ALSAGVTPGRGRRPPPPAGAGPLLARRDSRPCGARPKTDVGGGRPWFPVLAPPTPLWQASPARRVRRASAPRPDKSCRSSVVEHSLGKGEVDSSILSGSTTRPMKLPALPGTKARIAGLICIHCAQDYCRIRGLRRLERRAWIAKWSWRTWSRPSRTLPTRTGASSASGDGSPICATGVIPPTWPKSCSRPCSLSRVRWRAIATSFSECLARSICKRMGAEEVRGAGMTPSMTRRAPLPEGKSPGHVVRTRAALRPRSKNDENNGRGRHDRPDDDQSAPRTGKCCADTAVGDRGAFPPGPGRLPHGAAENRSAQRPRRLQDGPQL